jgi:hypothetical protein
LVRRVGHLGDFALFLEFALNETELSMCAILTKSTYCEYSHKKKRYEDEWIRNFMNGFFINFPVEEPGKIM